MEEENKGLKGDVKTLKDDVKILEDENLNLSKYATSLEKEQSDIFKHFTMECDGVRGLVRDGLRMQGERIVAAEVRIGRVESRQQGGH